MAHFAYDVFFSFASKNEDEARPLYEQMTASGLRVFWSDETLEGSVGESWYNEIGEALKSSRHLVLLWTAAAAKSKFVELEYSRFHSATIQEPGRLLVPILSKSADPSTIPFLLGNIQFFSMHDDFGALIKKLGGDSDGFANQEISYATRPEPTGAADTFTDDHGIAFILVKPGTFTMGDPTIPQAKPPHEVTLSQPYYLSTYPVTQQQWTAIMGSNPSRYPGDNHPVEQVSWDEAQSFLSKLGREYRLPTEAEWEYACRAGTTTAYSFGDNKRDLDTYAWHRQNAGDTTHPVGQKKPNPWGFYDMHGTVYEWVQDWYGPYGAEPTGSKRVIRGGSWSHFFKDLRSAARDGMPGKSKYSYLGLRVVREVVNEP